MEVGDRDGLASAPRSHPIHRPGGVSTCQRLWHSGSGGDLFCQSDHLVRPLTINDHSLCANPFAHPIHRIPAFGAVSSGTGGDVTRTGAVQAASSGARNHLAKVRVAGSNPVVRSKSAGQRVSGVGDGSAVSASRSTTRSTLPLR